MAEKGTAVKVSYKERLLPPWSCLPECSREHRSLRYNVGRFRFAAADRDKLGWNRVSKLSSLGGRELFMMKEEGSAWRKYS